MIRLHLGCGTRYLEGYLNIDQAPSEHTVQDQLVADQYADITKLQYPAGSIDEIRLHHVFEHFPRQIALALLCRWCDWLRPGGLLWIETPDVMGSAWALVSPFSSSHRKQQILRHLFGSHEAAWAAHWDGWHKERFGHTLAALDFGKLSFVRSRWEALYNIEVMAIRGMKNFGLSDYERIVENILKESLVTHRSARSSHEVAESEMAMLGVWMREWRTAYVG